MRPRYLAAICLFSLFGGLAPQYLVGASDETNKCPVTPLVEGRPAGAPAASNNRWFANADRAIWITFGGTGLRSVLGEPVDPATAKAPGHRVMWYKPSDSLLIVTGQRIDGDAPSLLYKLLDSGPMQPSEIDFPAAGCWQIEAKTSTAELRLVVLVKPGLLPTFFP